MYPRPFLSCASGSYRDAGIPSGTGRNLTSAGAFHIGVTPGRFVRVSISGGAEFATPEQPRCPAKDEDET